MLMYALTKVNNISEIYRLININFSKFFLTARMLEPYKVKEKESFIQSIIRNLKQQRDNLKEKRCRWILGK